MKLLFKNNIDLDEKIPFCIYHFDEVLAKKSNYIDIRSIVNKNCELWLEELYQSHHKLSRVFLKLTKWWWIIPAARLDARPWGQEEILKPLFFARAIIEWANKNKDIKILYLSNCPSQVREYLEEYNTGKFSLFGSGYQKRKSYILRFIKALILNFIKLNKSVKRLFREKFNNNKSQIDKKTIILFQMVKENNYSSSYKYYYGNIFDKISNNIKSEIKFVCTSFLGHNNCEERKQILNDKNTDIIFDYLKSTDIIIAYANTICILLFYILTFISNIKCFFGFLVTKNFWKEYLIYTFNSNNWIKNICIYRIVKRVISSDINDTVIFPYEEKDLEKAVLLGLRHKNILTIGYAPHPQHKLAISLKDIETKYAIKPKMYAVCGREYKPYFTNWAKKNEEAIKIWGSSKYNDNKYVLNNMKECVTCLLLLSHPNELRVFQSWLYSEKKLSINTRYLIRSYKAVPEKKFQNITNKITNEFMNIEICDGTLEEDLKRCDIALFCATSAGLLAVSSGYIAMYVNLNEFFEINPCFDNTKVFLPSNNAIMLSDNLDYIRRSQKYERKKIHRDQLSYVHNIFTKPNLSEISKNLKSADYD